MVKTKLSMSLPKVGDHLIRLMSASDLSFDPEPCIVTYVNEKNGWYQVTFEKTGIKECYGIPSFDHSILNHRGPVSIPVLCLETGYVYPSIKECEKDMGFSRCGITRQISGIYYQTNGYHFVVAL